jgi:phage FluMu gp28-like protein
VRYLNQAIDLVGFIERNITVREQPVKLYEYQKKILNDSSDFRIINKSRQIGISWLVAAEALVYALVNPNEVIMIVSVSHNAAKDVMGYIDAMYDSLPPHLKRRKNIDTKEEKKFDNNSRILSLPNNYRTVRGKPATRIYLDEYAHFGNEDTKMWESLMPSMSRGGKATIISTPLGKLGKFYEFWEDAEKQGWTKHEIHYQECPDILNRIEIIKQGLPDEMSFKQEYCCTFVDESTSFFPFSLILSCVDDELNDTDFKRDNLPTHMGVDFGKKVDSTVIVGTKKEDDVIFVKYVKEFVPPSILGDVVVFIKRNFKDWGPDRISIDQKGMGERMVEDLSELGSVVNGVIFTSATKESMITTLKIAMEDGKIKLPRNDKLIQQLHALRKVVTQTTIRYEHPQAGRVQHDDYVWALAMAVYDGVSTLPSGQPASIDGNVFDVKIHKYSGYSGGIKDY